MPASDTVVLCQDNVCSQQPRNIATFQGTPSDPQAERRLRALVELGEKYPKAAYDLGLRYLRGDGVVLKFLIALFWVRL